MRCGESRDDVAIAGVVAGTADDLPAPRVGKTTERGLDSGFAGAAHQHVTGHAVVLDRRSIGFAHGGDRVDVSG